ncbi:hypothetical protein BGZ65_006766 [Modicella reniformis]|uniref:Beta'-coat protein n=1 Tax=Modicella reniformis TaxID=1440133 RepID=A0A9P6J5C9_9FUNG|nr:hypothetical protein BGZ65_006766 [Modicella reniformis]
MTVTINPKDTNTFTSACVDRTVKVYAEKPYLVTACDDQLAKIWDYQNKTCVQTLEGHAQNVTFAVFHPELPVVIISGNEDGSVKILHAISYRLENTLNCGMNRAWAIAYRRSTNDVGLGFDLGSVAIKLGREEPTVSMDSGGKIIWARHNDIQTANIKASIGDEIKDGERIVCSAKDLGNCEVYPQVLQHSPNGRFVVVCGDGEFIIYTALAWRNKSFGSGLEFVWALDSNLYAVRESTSKVKVFKNFKERPNLIRLNYSAEGIFGGTLLGVRSANFLNLYDWESGLTVRRIDCEPKNVYWSETGDLMTIACNESFYVLRYNRNAYSQFVEAGGQVGEEGVEEALELVTEIPENVQTGCWVGDCFIYTNTSNRLNYLVGGQTQTIAHFDHAHYLLGYIPRDNRLYLVDKDVNVVSYGIPSPSLNIKLPFFVAILRLLTLLPHVPQDQVNKIARFLEGQDLKELALENKFDLAIQLERLDEAVVIARESDSEPKWKQLGDCAMTKWRINLAEECFVNAKDLSGLLLIYSSSGNAQGMKRLAAMAKESGKSNIAFACYISLGQVEDCIDNLIDTERIPEASMMARTYLPSDVPRVLQLWKKSLVAAKKEKTAETLADPTEYEDMFPNLRYSLSAEEAIKESRVDIVPATAYYQWRESLDRDIISDIKSGRGIPCLLAQHSHDGLAESTIDSYDESRLLHDQLNGNEYSRHHHHPVASSERADSIISDSMSHLSMEVNTTGTGSVMDYESSDQEQPFVQDDALENLI